jgi:hypothetical protein
MVGAVRSLARTRLARVERRLLVLLLCAPLLGLIGVILAEAVPDGPIADHLLDGERDGVLASEQGYATTPLDTIVQTPAECGALSIGLGDQSGSNHVTTAVVSPAYRGCPSLARKLGVYETTGELPPGSPHLRYWHGYALITRPALGLFGVAGARWIAFVLAVVTVGGTATAVARAFGVGAAAFLVAPFLLTTDAIIGGLAVSVAISTAAVWGGGWVSFTVVSRRPNWTTAALLAALAGALTAYLDLAIHIPGSYALTVVSAALGVIAADGAAALQRGSRVVVAAAIGWVTGLIWMWASKLIIAAIAVGVDEVVESVNSRIDVYSHTGGEWSAFYRSAPSRVHGLTDNLGAWWSKPLAPWVIAGILAALVVAAVRRRHGGRVMISAALCALLALVPLFGWYLAVPRHSQFHSWLVYRSIPIAFGGVAVLFYVSLTAPVGAPAARLGGAVGGEEAATGPSPSARFAGASRHSD